MMKETPVCPTKTITGREIAALLNPRLAVLVTCCDLAGEPNVFTVAWQTPLSHRPPLVGISVGCTRYSHRLISDTGEFVVNIVGRRLKKRWRLAARTPVPSTIK